MIVWLYLYFNTVNIREVNLLNKVDFNNLKNTYVILFLISFIVCLFLPVSWGDDTIFQEKSAGIDLLTFIDGSARPFTDSLTFIFSKHKILWRIFNPVIMISILYGVSSLLPFKINKKETIVLFICLMFPTMVIVDAGFIATTVNYLWAITFGIISFIPLKRTIEECKVKWFIYVLTYPLILYATNMQQMAVVLTLIYFFANVYLIIKKRFNFFVLGQFLIAAVGLGWAFCLNMFGDNNRMLRETGRYFPKFGELNLIEKVELGFSSTFYCLIMNPHFAAVGFLAFTLFISVIIIKKKETLIKRVLSVIPPIFSVVMCVLKYVPDQSFYSMISGGMYYYRMEKAVYSFKPVTDIIFILLILCVLYSLYNVFKSKVNFYRSFIILCFGLGTRIMMGFSPTVWASGHRTFSIMFITFIIVGFLVYNDYKDNLIETNKNV